MATENHHQGSGSCLDDPNFATICSFLEKFGDLCHINTIPFAQLQEMLENTNEVPLPLVQLHIRLLRRVFKSINTSKWEKSVSKFAHMFNSQDGWEIERFGYKKSKMQTKLRILKNLLESQFDYNPKFKGEVNKLLASDLRMVPIGRDQQGHAYWYQVDGEANLRVYREDMDEETWEIVASSREELEQLIGQLKSGEIIITKSPEDATAEEETNGLESMDIEPKEILLDTGKPVGFNEGTNDGTESNDDENDDSMDVCEGFDDNSADEVDVKPETEVGEMSASKQSKPMASNGDSGVISSSINNVSAEPRAGDVKNDSSHVQLTNSNGEVQIVSNNSATNQDRELKLEVKSEPTDVQKETIRVTHDLLKAGGTTAVSESPYFESTQVKEERTDENVNAISASVPKETEKLDDPYESQKSSQDGPVDSVSHYFTSQSEVTEEKPDAVKESSPEGFISSEDKAKDESDLSAAVVSDEKSAEVSDEVVPQTEETMATDVPVKELTAVSPAEIVSDGDKENPTELSRQVSSPVVAHSSLAPACDSSNDKSGVENQALTSTCVLPEPESSHVEEHAVVASANVQAEDQVAKVSDTEGHSTEIKPTENLIDSNSQLRAKVDTDLSVQAAHEELTRKFPGGEAIPEVPHDVQASTLPDGVQQIEKVPKAPPEQPSRDSNDSNIANPEAMDVAPPATLTSAAAQDSTLLPEETTSASTIEASAEENMEWTPVPQVSDEKHIVGITDSELAVATAAVPTEGMPTSASVHSETAAFSESETQAIPHSKGEDTSTTATDGRLGSTVPPEPDPALKTDSITEESGAETVARSEAIISEKEDPVVKPVETEQSSESLQEARTQEVGGTDLSSVPADSVASLDPLPPPAEETVASSSPADPEASCTTKTLLEAVNKEQQQLERQDNASSPAVVATEASTEAVTASESQAGTDINVQNSATITPVAMENHGDKSPLVELSTDGTSPAVVTKATVVIPPDSSAGTETTPQKDSAIVDETENADSTPAITSTVIPSQANKQDETGRCSPSTSESTPPTEPVKVADAIVPEQHPPAEHGAENPSVIGQLSQVESSTVDTPPGPVDTPKVVPPEDIANDAGPGGEKCSESLATERPSETTAEAKSESVEPKTTEAPKPSAPVTEETSKTAPSTSTEKQTQKLGLGLVAYGSSSEDESEDNEASNEGDNGGANGIKRKSEARSDDQNEEQPAKIAKVDAAVNPIVGEAIEESVMIITGSGEGALNEGGNELPTESPAGGVASDDNEDDDGGHLPSKQKGRGRAKKGNKKVLKDKNVTEKKAESKPSRRNSFNSDEMNGVNSSAPVRRSGRVAQIRQKEEEERRKLEEERLAQLKEAQLRKQQKQLEKELKAETQGNKPPKSKTPKKPKAAKGSKSSKQQQQQQVAYLPSSESESESEPEDLDEEEYGGGRGRGGKQKRKKRSKNGKGTTKRGSTPWLHSSSEEDEAVEEEEEEHVEEEEEELHFNASDHEFSPESDVGDDSEYSPSRHARTAKQKEEAVEDKYAETYCDKCGKGDHPEWILLCDSCDKGWHALCVNPQIWVIPEGEWFCPPCQHNMLVNKLSENLVEYDKLLKKRENEVLRKQRLAYVGISLNNVLPSAEKPEKSDGENGQEEEKETKKSKQRRRRLYSDPEDIGNFINDNESGSEDESGSGSYESEEEEPIYRLRQRRATKGFSFREYDDMIKSALRDSDAEDGENQMLEEPPKKVTDNGVSGNHTDEVDKKADEGENAKEGEESDEEENIGARKKPSRIQDDETDEEELDEKERNRRKMLNSNQKKSRRRLNDLDATSEEDSDEDFKGSEVEDEDDDEEEAMVEEDSDWSGGGDESDDSIAAARSRKKKHGPLGRREKYLEVGMVRRSTRRRKSRVTYDESDQEEDEEDQTEKWQSGESEESESDSESDDETWGKKKKKKGFPAGKSKLPNFFLNANVSPKKSKTKKKKRKVDEGEVDRAWSNKFGNKVKKAAQEPIERKTRGRKINFKDILDSGESDDDGNIRPKRRRILSDSDDDEEPGSSRRLVEEIRAANVRAMAEEKLRAEEKMREVANVEKQQKKEAAQPVPADPAGKPTLPIAPILTPASVAVAASAVPPPAEINPLLGSLDVEKDRGLKITNSIVESLLRKSPNLPESPPTTASAIPPVHILTEAAGVLPPLRGLAQPPYLPTVLPPVPVPSIPPSGPGSGSARVGKKKTASMLGTPASSASDVLPFPSSAKKSSNSIAGAAAPPPKPVAPPVSVPSSSPPNSNLPPSGLPPNISSDLARLAGPMYGNNPALRPFHPAWGRNPPPYSGPAGHSLGKPPPLSSTGFMGQPGQLRGHLPPSNYPQAPPGLRIPNPSSIPAFQQFGKRPGDVGAGPYRMPPASQQIPGTVLSSMARERERIFIGGSSPYGSFGMLPPTQGQGQQHPGLFANPFEYRPPETFKDDLLERSVSQSVPVTSGAPVSQSQTPPSSGASSGPPIAPPMATAAGHKDDGGSQGDGEFGGLVSYFSSQHSNDED